MSENITQENTINTAEESTSPVQVASELDNDPTSATQEPEKDLVQTQPGSDVINMPTEPDAAEQSVPGSPDPEPAPAPDPEPAPAPDPEPEVIEEVIAEEIPHPPVKSDVDWALMLVILLVALAVMASIWYYFKRLDK